MTATGRRRPALAKGPIIVDLHLAVAKADVTAVANLAADLALTVECHMLDGSSRD
jgi:hypothetical protein